MQQNRETVMDRLFGTYRQLLGDFEPTPTFAARVWRAIEARKLERTSWAAYLISWAPRLACASVAVAAMLIAAQWTPLGNNVESALLDASYVDVLTLDSLDEQDGALWVLAENGQ
jgi:hypothetical protein